MNLDEFFGSPQVELPRTWGGSSYFDASRELFDGYQSALRQVTPQSSLAQRIAASETQDFVRDLCSKLLCAVTHSESGHEDEAFVAVSQALCQAKGCPSLISVPVSAKEIGCYYRVQRVKPECLSKGRLFHAPWHMRHLVGSHRFGIAEYPCLYLGGCLELCQKESDISDADLETMGIARFELQSKLTILDFGYRPNAMPRIIELGNGNLAAKVEDLIVEYVRCWPLIASCMVRRRAHAGASPIEYRIPQLVLRWLSTTNDCDGVRYFSTRVEPNLQQLKRSFNLVFPAKEPRDEDGYATKLRAAFAITDPCMWQRNGVKDVVSAHEQNEKQLGRLRADQF